jgi:hypothetical protein
MAVSAETAVAATTTVTRAVPTKYYNIATITVSIQQQQQIKQLVAKAAVGIEVPFHLRYIISVPTVAYTMAFNYSSVTTAEAANKAAVTKVEATTVIVIASIAVIGAAIIYNSSHLSSAMTCTQ